MLRAVRVGPDGPEVAGLEAGLACDAFLGEEFKVPVEGLVTPVASGVGDALSDPVSEPEAAAAEDADWDGGLLVVPASASAAASAVKEYARCGAATAAVRFMESVHVNTDCDCEEFLVEEFKVPV